MDLRIKAITDEGRVREHNEDSILIGDRILRQGSIEVAVSLTTIQAYSVAVADGMGGHNAGEVASQMILERLREVVSSLETGLNKEELAKKFEAWARVTHACILGEGNRDPNKRGMGTTLVGVLFYGDRAYYINIGDSRLYRLRDGYLVQITRDHSLREVTGDKSIPSNVILNSFGAGGEIFIDFAPVGTRLLDGDNLLLCSDGLWDMLPDGEIEEILKTDNDPVATLLNKANDKGGMDNISIVLIQIQA